MNVRPDPVPLRADPAALTTNAMRSLTRAALATAQAALSNYGKSYAEDVAAKAWPHDREALLVTKGATSPLTIADSHVHGVISLALLRHLMPVSAGANILGASLAVSFSGTAQIKVPAIALPTLGFVREGSAIPMVTLPTGPGAVLDPAKLAVLVGLTREMMDSSNAETIVRQVLIDSCAALDSVLFDSSAAVAETRPPGLRNGITALAPSASTDKASAMSDDTAALVAAVASVGGTGTIELIASPKHAVALMMRVSSTPSPVHMSTALADKTVIAVATNALAAAVDVPSIEASRDSVVHMENSAPAPINSSGTMATPIYSMYQADSVCLRLRWPISWGLRDQRGIAFMNAVTC